MLWNHVTISENLYWDDNTTVNVCCLLYKNPAYMLDIITAVAILSLMVCFLET